MNPIGFTIVDGYALKLPDVFIDLHNEYEFAGYTMDTAAGTLILSWVLIAQAASPGHSSSVRMIVRHARQVRVLPPKDDWSAGGGRTLRFVGFLHVDQADVMNGCVDYHEAGESPDFIVGFEDESALKVFGYGGSLQVEICGEHVTLASKTRSGPERLSRS